MGSCHNEVAAVGVHSARGSGPDLSRRTVADGVPLLTALFVAAGDAPERCRTSVEDGWAELTPT
jgi:hypothetical protein